jgi:hypothetical protein
MIKTIDFNHDSFSGLILKGGYEIIEIRNNVFDYVFKKEAILKLRSLLLTSEIIDFTSPSDGRIIELPIAINQIVNMNDHLFSIETSDSIQNFTMESFEFNKKKLHDTIVEMDIDEFTDNKTIWFTKVAGLETEYLKFYSNTQFMEYPMLGITFQNFNGFVYARFESFNEHLTLEANDSIILLFEDNIKINYTFKNDRRGEKYSYRNSHVLTSDDLMIFENKSLLKVKLTSYRKGIYEIYHLQNRYPHSQYKSEIEGQYLLKFMASMFVKFHIANQLALPNEKK